MSDGAEAYAPPATRLAEQEADILAHMNADYARDQRECCRHGHGKTVSEARMVGIDCDGFDVRADGVVLRFDFERPVANAAGVREALRALAGRARTA